MEPNKIKIPFLVKKPILALGGHTKNTLCFAQGDTAYISPLHQDLGNWHDYLSFRKDLELFLKKKPKITACDLHMGYQSSVVAEKLSSHYNLKKIQHHHSHIASGMVENGLKNEMIIGVAFDGTGLGADNNLWGAEFFIGNYQGFLRKAQLEYIPLPGAEMAIRQPWRVALSWLYRVYKEKLFQVNIPFIRRINSKKWRLLKTMLDNRINSPLSSSMGRLFDAVGTILCDNFSSVSEAQIPKELENLAKKFKGTFFLRGYPCKIKKDKGMYIITPVELFKELIQDIKEKKKKEEIAFKFHLSISLVTKEMCLRLRQESGLNKIVLSGGVFLNNILREMIFDLLYKSKFEVFFQRGLFSSDAGISLGQMALANFSK